MKYRAAAILILLIFFTTISQASVFGDPFISVGLARYKVPVMLRGGSTSPSVFFQSPGPSAVLFNAPYYTCTRNFYINASTGNDTRTSAQAQSPATPWLTIAKYDSGASSPAAGDCINVASGTYAAGVRATHGGSSSTSTGYIVYRCQTMNGCTITDNGSSVGALGVNGNPGPNFVWFDGFTLTASSAVASGIGVNFSDVPGTTPSVFCCHHLWLTNSIVSGYGQSGFQGGLVDFVYLVHNTFHHNATADCSSQGSGISMVWPQEASGYTLVADDKSNSVTGNLAANGGDWFRQVYSWNIVYNNAETGCGPNTSDGNGIIMDQWWGNNGSPGPGVYKRQGLISFNVVYNNGGKGIHIFENDNGTVGGTAGVGITVANNSAFNNNLDTNNPGTTRYEIGETQGSKNTFVNNAVYTIRGASAPLNANFPMIGDSSGGGASTFNNNVAHCVGTGCANASTGMFNGAVWTAGKGLNDPLWVNVGNSSAGTISTQPSGVNFSLCIGNGNPAGCTATSPALGYLLSETYLPAGTQDSGACDHTLGSCP